MNAIVSKENNNQKILKRCLEIIRYFIKNDNKKKHPQQICKGIHGRKGYRPGELGSHYSNIRKKCKDLLDLKILVVTREISKPKTSYKADFYKLNEKMDFKYFREIARYYLDWDSKYYEDRMIFMENGFVQQYIKEDFVKKISENINVTFPEFYTKTLLPSLLSCFPSSLYQALFYEDEDYEQLKESGKKITKKLEKRILYRFLTFIKLSIYNDLYMGEYLAPDYWTKIDFMPHIEIFFEYEKDLHDLTLKEIKSLCKKHNIKTTDMKKAQLIKSLGKKSKTTKIEEKSKTSITIPGSFSKKFR